MDRQLTVHRQTLRAKCRADPTSSGSAKKHVDAVEEQTMDSHTKKEGKIVPPSQKIAMLVEKEDTSVSAASVKIKDL